MMYFQAFIRKNRRFRSILTIPYSSSAGATELSARGKMKNVASANNTTLAAANTRAQIRVLNIFCSASLKGVLPEKQFQFEYWFLHNIKAFDILNFVIRFDYITISTVKTQADHYSTPSIDWHVEKIAKMATRFLRTPISSPLKFNQKKYGSTHFLPLRHFFFKVGNM